MKRTVVMAFLLVLALLYGGDVTLAQGGETFPTDNDVNAIAKKLYCPVCPNTPLDVCETLACQEWRAQIRDQLAAGWSEEEIINYFVSQYGERVLAEPQRQGFSSLAWFFPILALLLGIAIVVQVLRTWRRRVHPLTVPGTPPEVPPEVAARVEQEIRDLL